MSGKALPAHEASQRGAPVSGEALPAHEAGQRGGSRERKGASCARGRPGGSPVSGNALPAHEAISEGGLGLSAF